MGHPVVLVIAAFGVAVAALTLVRAARERRRTQARALAALGFQSVGRLEPRIADELLTAYQPRWRESQPGGFELLDVYEWSASEGEVYLFDFQTRGRAESSVVVTRALGTIRAGSRLPFFKIYRVPADGGRASKVARGLIGLGLGERRVVGFDEVPEFDHKFTVIATGNDDEERVRQLLTPEIRRGFLDLGFWILMAGGDALILTNPEASLLRRGTGASTFEAFVEELQRAATILFDHPAP
jgi:hypothetical protein